MKDDIAFGKEQEGWIAREWCKHVYTQTSTALCGLPEMSALDWVVIDNKNGKVLTFLEIKARRISSSQYDSVLVPMTKIEAAKAIRETLLVPSFIVVKYTDTLLAINLAQQYDHVRYIERRDRPDKKPILHVEFMMYKAKAYNEKGIKHNG